MKLKNSLKVGFGFGLTSGIITTLGLMMGLSSSTHSKLPVIGGILTIAIADALSDALGVHVSQEAEDHHTNKEIWVATFFTFLFKFIFALTFLIPVIFIASLDTAVVVSIVWGLFLLIIFNFYLVNKKRHPWRAVGEHLLIAIIVIILSYLVGNWIGGIFT